MNHAFHQFPLDEESQELFVFWTPWGLYKFKTLAIGIHTASSECQEKLRRVLEGLDGVCQIQDDIVVHRFMAKGRFMTRGKCSHH